MMLNGYEWQLAYVFGGLHLAMLFLMAGWIAYKLAKEGIPDAKRIIDNKMKRLFT